MEQVTSRMSTKFTLENLPKRIADNVHHLSSAYNLALRRSSAHWYYGTGAVIVQSSKSREIGNGWSHISNIRHKQTFSMHAEIHALARTHHLLDHHWIGYEIYVVNVRKYNGSIANSQPCLSCAVALAAAGIGTAIFANKDGTVELLDLESELTSLKNYKFRE